jgi:hypothetical protein
MKIHEFNESLLQRYTNPGASNVIILLLLADTPEDLSVQNFKREIHSLKKYQIFLTSSFFFNLLALVLE